MLWGLRKRIAQDEGSRLKRLEISHGVFHSENSQEKVDNIG